MQAISSSSKDFPYKEVQELYTENKQYFENPDYPFENFLEDYKGHIWAFVEDNKLIGYIFLHSFTDDSCGLSGDAHRKCTKYISEAINGTCGFYFATYPQLKKIFSTTDHKHAQLALKRAGFVQINTDKFLKERNLYNGKF